MKEKEITGLDAALFSVIKAAVYAGTREALKDHFTSIEADQKNSQAKKVEPTAEVEKQQAPKAVAQDTQDKSAGGVAQDTQDKPKKQTAKKSAPVIAAEDLPTAGKPLPEQKAIEEKAKATKPANEPTAEATASDFDDVEDIEETPIEYQKDCVPLCAEISRINGGVNELQRLLKVYGVDNLKHTEPARLRDLYNDLKSFLIKKAA